MKTALGLVYFYIDVVQDEIKEAESFSDTAPILSGVYAGGEINALRKMKSRLNCIATAMEGDISEQAKDKLVDVIINGKKQDTMMYEDVMGGGK